MLPLGIRVPRPSIAAAARKAVPCRGERRIQELKGASMNTSRLAAALALAMTLPATPPANAADPAPVTRAFTAKDLVMLDRISDPQLAPDGRSVAYSLRQTDFDADKGVRSIWLLALGAKDAQPRRLTAPGSSADSPRWSADGKTLYFLSSRSGSNQVWRLDEGLGEARQVTSLPLDVNNFVLAPDGRRLLLSV